MLKLLVQALGATTEAVSDIWPDRKELRMIQTVDKALVKNVLGKAGIAVTPQIAMIVDGAIEATCLLLPHEAPAEPVLDSYD